MKNKIVLIFKNNADKVVHQYVGRWLLLPVLLCDLFSVCFYIWLAIAIILPIANELLDKLKSKGSGWSNQDLLATYLGEIEMMGIFLLFL